jgi:chemotaxis signal transduction protein
VEPTVTGLRGRLVPVPELGARLGSESPLVAEAEVVIVESGGGTEGVIVEEAEGVLTVAAFRLEPAPGAGAEAIVTSETTTRRSR